MNRPHEGYDAFISYSEAFDGAITPAVQRALERLARPRPRRPALSVFRDETGLSVTDDLWGEIKKALLASRYLIVICSPSAAASDWVAKEIKFWLESHQEDLRIILVMTDGEWRWSESDNDFDWPASSSVPQELRGAFRAEPLAANLLGLRRNQLTLRNDRFRRQVAKIASPIREQPLEQLDNAEKRSQRRSDLLKTTSAAVLVLLMALSLILYHANSVSNQVAMSRELAAAAGSKFDSNPYVSMLLSVSAEKVAATTEAASVLLRQSYGREGLTSLFQGLGTGDRFVHCLSYGGRSDVLAYCTGDNVLVRNRKSVGYSTFALPVRHAVNSALFLKGSPFLLVGAGSALEFWDVVHKREVRVLEIPKGNIQRIVASGDGSVVAVSTDQAYIAVWKIRSGDRLMIPVVADNTRALSLNSDGSRIAYTNSGKVILRNLRSNQAEVIRSRDGSAVSLAVDPANDCIAVGYGDGFVSLWNAAGSQLLARQRISADSQVTSLVFTTSSSHLLGT